MIMRGIDASDVNWCVFDKINAEKEKTIMLHFSMLAVLACILSMVPLRQAELLNRCLSCLTNHLHEETYTLR